MRNVLREVYEICIYTIPVFMRSSADILHSSKPARHPGIGVELFHNGLSHSEVVGVTSGLQRSQSQPH